MRYSKLNKTSAVLVLFMSMIGYGQDKLKKGDLLTGVKFQKVINYHKKSINVDRDFKDKLVIFDNWGDWCYPCVRDLPRLDSLQRKFEDKIQILPWTEDARATAKNIYDRINVKYDMVIPSAVEATRENNLGTKAINAIAKIWWYNGEIVAVTKSMDVNAKNIQQFLDTGSFTPKKVEHPGAKDINVPIFSENLLYEMHKTGITVKIGNRISGFHPGIGYFGPKQNLTQGRRFINYTLKQLYQVAFNASKYFLDVDLASFLGYAKDNEIDTFCVEIKVENTSGLDYYAAEDKMRLVLRHALEAIFGFTMVRETRTVPTYVLKEIPGNKRFVDNSGGEEVWDKTAYHLNIDNMAPDRAFKAITGKLLSPYHPAMYAVNELKHKGNMALDLLARTNDYQSMKSALAEYGLDLSVEEREREVWVIQEIGKKTDS